jgi:hypothetical protein
MTRARRRGQEDIPELLLDLTIIQLGIAGVPQQAIRQIAGCDMGRVNRILKHINAARKKQPTRQAD